MVKVIWTKKAFGQLGRAIKYIREEQELTFAETGLNKDFLYVEELIKYSNPK